MTTSKSKAKGTGGEREVLTFLRRLWPKMVRTPPASRWDLQHTGQPTVLSKAGVLHVLATRSDRGRWLYTMDESSLESLAKATSLSSLDVYVEVKRYKKMQIHTIFEGKFSGSLGRPRVQQRQAEEG